MADSNPKRSYSQKASKVVTQHADRTMKSYLILESELHHIATLSTWATFFWSAFFSCGSLAFGLWSDMFIEGSPSPEAMKNMPPLQWAFVAGAALFLGLALWATRSKRSEVDRVKRESEGS
jgi:hypothetical protein